MNLLKLLFSSWMLLQTMSYVYSQQFIFKNYSVEDGLAQSQVFALLKDSRGLLWIGTKDGGLCSYDGLQFKTYTEKDGLLSNHITDIKEDASKDIWIASHNGLTKYNGVQFKNFKLNEKFNIVKMNFSADGDLWLACGDFLRRFDGKSFHKIALPSSLSSLKIQSLACSESVVWVGTDKQLLSYEIETKTWNTHHQSFKGLKNSIASLLVDENKNIWVGTYGDGVYRYNQKKSERIDLKNELKSTTVLDIFCDKAGNIWFTTLNNGAFSYHVKKKIITHLHEENGLSSNHIRNVVQDHSGNYWFGTSGAGLCHYLGRQFINFNSSSGIKGKLVYCIASHPNSKEIWIGTDKGASVFRKGKWLNYTSENGFTDKQVKSIYADKRSGKMLIGTEGKGVFVLDRDSIFTPLEGLKTGFIRAFCNDSLGNIWIATADKGLFRYQLINNEFVSKNWNTNNSKIETNRLNSLFVLPSGKLLIGTHSFGLKQLDDKGEIQNFLKKGQEMPSCELTAIILGEGGTVWIGTVGYGIFQIDVNKRVIVKDYNDKQSQLSSNNIYFILKGHNGDLYVGSEKGLDILQTFQKDSLILKKHIGQGDRFGGIETCRGAIFRDHENNIWMGTINGLVKYFPNEKERKLPPPILRLTDLKLFYKSLGKKESQASWFNLNKASFKHNQNHLSFEFHGINFNNPKAVKYRWKLEGQDENWSPKSEENKMIYTNLSPGEYRFLVKASNDDDESLPLEASFYIDRPFWKTWWFISIGILIFIGIIWGLVNQRIKNIRRIATEKEQTLRREKDLLELEQKALQLQMNPHFIFNALTSIQSQIGTGNDNDARLYLAKFSQLMRLILDHSTKSSVTLEEEIEILESYLLIEQYLSREKFDFEIIQSLSIPPDFINIPPMMIQPFAENAIKHGFRQLSTLGRKGKIVIHFSGENNLLKCEITDNGVGRNIAQQRKKDVAIRHISHALNVVKKRLEFQRKSIHETQLRIEDLGSDEKPLGTKVTIILGELDLD
jgi:ligand-binding sensor domain-containing protein/two-component sensor histidine kinase